MGNLKIDYDKVGGIVSDAKMHINGLNNGNSKKCATKVSGMATTKGKSVTEIEKQLKKDDKLAKALSKSLGQFINSIDRVKNNMKSLDSKMSKDLKNKR